MIAGLVVEGPQLDVEIATLILAVVGVSLILAVGFVLMGMIQRQRRDLVHNRKISKMLLDLATQIEHEERRTRHAIKNIIPALEGILLLVPDLPIKPNFSRIIESLEEPPDFPTSDPARLIEALVEVDVGE